MPESLTRKPSAYVPVLMSLAALSIVLVHAARYGVVHEADEGAAAHSFQLLIAAQVPVVAYFLYRWLPRARLAALRIFAGQVAAVVLAMAAVYFFTD